MYIQKNRVCLLMRRTIRLLQISKIIYRIQLWLKFLLSVILIEVTGNIAHYKLLDVFLVK